MPKLVQPGHQVIFVFVCKFIKYLFYFSYKFCPLKRLAEGLLSGVKQ